MRDSIAVLMAVLGTLLVLAGAGVIVAKAVVAPADVTAATVPAPTTGARLLGVLRQVEAYDRLIIWGIVLLVLAAVTSGAISFNVDAAANSK